MFGFLNKEKKEREKAEKRREISIQIEEFNQNLEKILTEYKSYVKVRKSFYMELEEDSDPQIVYNPEIRNKHGSVTKMGATLVGGIVGYAATSGVKTVYHPELKVDVHREGFHGTITFYNDYIELIPEEEGPTFRIPFDSIRKIKIEVYKPKKLDPTRPMRLTVDLSSGLHPYNGVALRIYTHKGDLLLIKIYNTVTSSKGMYNYDYGRVESSVDHDGYLNFFSYYDTVKRWEIQSLVSDLKKIDEELAFKFCENYLEIGYLMNEALGKHLEELFGQEFEKWMIDSEGNY